MYSLSPLLFIIVLEPEHLGNKENKMHSNSTGKSKLVFVNDMVLYVENPK